MYFYTMCFIGKMCIYIAWETKRRETDTVKEKKKDKNQDTKTQRMTGISPVLYDKIKHAKEY